MSQSPNDFRVQAQPGKDGLKSKSGQDQKSLSDVTMDCKQEAGVDDNSDLPDMPRFYLPWKGPSSVPKSSFKSPRLLP